ncbi:MAG: sigma-54-dependent Fis family transcriptional regulator [Planctomycetes bacterium]|nr:sigma-54-dependent Fis family transcriptional regulator [Planctomycetota bacterium]
MSTADANANGGAAEGRDAILGALAELVRRAHETAPELLDELPDELARLLQPYRAEVAADGDEHEWHGLTGSSPPMLALRKLIGKFAPTNAPVLITGDSGTGKERVAQALHELSRRSQGPMVAENCAAIPATLLESVLFGHKKGAFTGAIADHPGHFLAAHKGTLFLDEIGEMPLPLQAKLLRVLQEGEVRAVGDSKVRKIDVRMIAATNQDLERRVKAGTFREDLFFRLNVLRIEMPRLRERGDDILVLARRFLAAAGASMGRRPELSAAAAAALLRAPWPGNVRQLQNEIQRAVALGDGGAIDLADLSPEIAEA